MEREEPHLIQREIAQPLLQVLQQILPEGHALKIIEPAVQGEAVVPLGRYADGDAQIHDRAHQHQQVAERQQHPAAPLQNGGKLFHPGASLPYGNKIHLIIARRLALRNAGHGRRGR